MRHFRHESPMGSPLGVKLLDLGFFSLWDYVAQHGFTDLDSFKSEIGFSSLVPIGFYDFLLACAELNNHWSVAVQIGASDFLNMSRLNYAVESPGSDWMVIHPVSRLATLFGDEVAWAQSLTFAMRDYLLEHRSLFDTEFHYNDTWLVTMVDGAASGIIRGSPRRRRTNG